MSYFATTVLREIQTMSSLCDAYEKQLVLLPKGSVQIKQRKDKKYFYLVYRTDGKIVSKYIGNDEGAIFELREHLERRKGIEALLKGIKKELVSMNKILEDVK